MTIPIAVSKKNRVDKFSGEELAGYLKTILDNLIEGCQIIDFNFRYVYVNNKVVEQGRKSKEELLGHTMMEVYPGIERTKMFSCLTTCMEERVFVSMENEFKYPDSDKRWFELRMEPISQGVIIFSTDITERKKAEQTIISRNRKLEELTKTKEKTKKAMLNLMEDLEEARRTIELEKARDEAILASIGDGIVAVDKNGKVVLINKAGCSMLGFKSHELIRKKFVDIVEMTDEKGNVIPKNKRPIQMVTKKRADVLTNTTTERPVYNYVRRDGTRFPVAVKVTPIVNGKATGAIEIFRDISRELEVDRAKSEFVSLASHQLRTPLGIIKWYLEALEGEKYFKKAPKDIRKYFDEIYKNNERILSLVRDLLSVSRIDQGRVKNTPKPVDPVAQIREVVEQMQIIASKRNITLNLDVSDKKINTLTIDALRFREVIENLIVNAIQYSKDKGSVQITVKKQADMLIISIADNGVGISKEDKKKLFTKFFRSEKANEYNPEGTGLGLYVVKSYVEGWGGKVTVESEEGEGSNFTFSLPTNKNIKKPTPQAKPKIVSET